MKPPRPGNNSTSNKTKPKEGYDLALNRPPEGDYKDSPSPRPLKTKGLTGGLRLGGRNRTTLKT